MIITVATTGYHDLVLPQGYCYMEVGSSCHERRISGILHDDEGENISWKNDTYCELTALYWLWKNSEDQVLGLCHYRRLFSEDMQISMFPLQMEHENRAADNILKEDKIRCLLKNHDLILPMPYEPGDCTAREDLHRFVSEKDIAILEDLMEGSFPDYFAALQTVFASRNLSYCNMLIAGRAVFDGYCSFLFDFLEKYEKVIDLSGHSTQQRRIFGYVSEVLLNVYVEANHLVPAYVNILAVTECFGKSAAQKTAARFYTVIQKACRGKIGKKIYRMYFQKRYPKRYENFEFLENKWMQDRKKRG